MSLYRSAFALFHKNYLMYAMLGVLISSCLGAAAALLVLHQGHNFIQMVELTLLVCGCMGYNATILSNQKDKIVFNALLISSIISIIILLIHII